MSEVKEIIIDGVNVSECKHLYIPQETKICQCLICETGEFVQCKRESNCYFKQFKRLQQELDIKEKMLDKFMIDSGKTLEKLQEENEELKKEVSNWKNLKPIDITDFCKVAEKTLDSNNKYKQALEEIRKKITPVCAYCDNIDGFTTWDDCENVCEKGVIKYLKIIDEVLNDRN